MARIEHFAVFAADPDGLKDFYVRAFGMKVVLDERRRLRPGYFLADDQGMALEIIGRPAGESNVNQRWVCHVAFWVDDVARKRGRARGPGAGLRDRDRRGQRGDQDRVLPRSRGEPLPDLWRSRTLGA